MGMAARQDGTDRASSVSRVLLGLGVVVGPLYLAVGVILALASEGFDFSTHPLSLLMLGEHGWIQATNLIVSGLLAVAAGVGVARASRARGATRWIGLLVIGYGACVTGGGIFPPDAMPGFPPGTTEATVSTSGLLHLMLGGVGFLLLGAAAITAGTSCARREERRAAAASYVAGAVIILGFLSGAVLPTLALGVASLWLAVVVGWAWLAVTAFLLSRLSSSIAETPRP